MDANMLLVTCPGPRCGTKGLARIDQLDRPMTCKKFGSKFSLDRSGSIVLEDREPRSGPGWTRKAAVGKGVAPSRPPGSSDGLRPSQAVAGKAGDKDKDKEEALLELVSDERFFRRALVVLAGAVSVGVLLPTAWSLGYFRGWSPNTPAARALLAVEALSDDDLGSLKGWTAPETAQDAEVWLKRAWPRAWPRRRGEARVSSIRPLPRLRRTLVAVALKSPEAGEESESAGEGVLLKLIVVKDADGQWLLDGKETLKLTPQVVLPSKDFQQQIK